MLSIAEVDCDATRRGNGGGTGGLRRLGSSLGQRPVWTGGALLGLLGLVCGLQVPLMRVTSLSGVDPAGAAFWVNAIGAVFCLGAAAMRGRLTLPHRSALCFFAVYGVLSGAMTETLMFLVAAHVEAAPLSVLIVTEGLIVFGIAAAVRLEKARGRRLFGLLAGLAGTAVMVLSRWDGATGSHWIWMLAALGVPLGFALEDALIARWRPTRVEPLCFMGYMMGFASLVLLPVVLVFGTISPAESVASMITPFAFLGASAALSVAATFLLLILIRSHGAVFAGQNGYATAFAGLIWSALLLGEELSPLDWGTLALIVVGIACVGPHDDAKAGDPAPLRAPATPDRRRPPAALCR